MSWDVMVLKVPEGFTGSFSELPKDWMPEDICTHEYLENEIIKIFPDINGETLNRETYSIEFNFGEHDPIKDIMLNVRGGQEALEAIKIFSEKLNCKAYDTTEGKIIDFNEKTNKGFSEWQEYRNKVINKTNE